MRLISLLCVAILFWCAQTCLAGQSVTRSQTVTVNAAPAPAVETIAPAVNEAPADSQSVAQANVVQSTQQTQTTVTRHKHRHVRGRRHHAATMYIVPSSAAVTYNAVPTAAYTQTAPLQRSYSSSVTRSRSSGGCQCGCGSATCNCGR